jgi:hypothetical protein
MIRGWHCAGPHDVLNPAVQVEFPDPAWGVEISAEMQSLLTSVSRKNLNRSRLLCTLPGWEN